MSTAVRPVPAPPVPAGGAPAPDPTLGDAAVPADVSAVALLGVLVRRRRSITLWALGLGLLVAGAVLLRPRTYTAASVFIPQSKRGAANLTALAAQFGVAVPGGEPGQSPAFYAEFVKLRSVMSEVAARPYRSARGSLVRLPDVFRLRARNDSLLFEATLNQLDDATVADVDLKTSTVRLSVTTRDPAVSQQVNARVLDYINAFNLRSRQTQAAAERRFTEQRFDEASADLRQAEDRQQGFLQANRAYSGSPELTFQQDRLAREVSLRQQVRATLAQALEQAKIEEVRDTPLITVIEPPTVPVLPDARGLVKLAVLATLGGAVLGALLALLSDALAAGVRGGDPHWRELDATLRGFGHALRHPFRRAPRRPLPPAAL